MKRFCCCFSVLQAVCSGSTLRWPQRNVVKRILFGLVAVSVVVLAGVLAGSHHVKVGILQTSVVVQRRNNPVYIVDEGNRVKEVKVAVNRTSLSADTWDVIVSTYMRSGSSFLGQMLGHRNDSFYWYEPLWRKFPWRFHREDGKLCDYLKPSCGQDMYIDTALHFLSDVYNCRLTAHAHRIVENLHTSSSFAGPSWEAYRMCRRKPGNARKSPGGCLAEMEPVCRSAAHRVTKVLRLDFAYIEKLLQDNPRLKAILLLRDPRGILSSHIYSGWFPMKRNDTNALANDAEVLCSRMDRDIKSAKSMISLYPNRVKIVQYEDFDDPIRKLKTLYSFLNMDEGRLPLRLVETNSTSDKSRDLFSYRTKLDWGTVQILDSHCGNVYRELGLVQYKDEKHLRDVAQTPIINTLPYSLEIR